MTTIDYRVEREKAIRSSWNVHDRLKGRSMESLRSYQSNDSAPFGVCILNLLGDLNVGIILRTAALTGAKKVFIFGRKKYDKRSTVGAYKYLDIEHIDNGMLDEMTVDPNTFHLTLFENHFYPVFVEQGGVPLQEYDWHPVVGDGFMPCLVFGNEGHGVPDNLMEPGCEIVSIEQRGVIRSFNVSSAASIVMYHLSQRLSSPKIRSDTLPNRNHLMAF